MVQTRLSRWHTRIKDRPEGIKHIGRTIQITPNRQHLYVLCDDGVLVCVDVPWRFRDELELIRDGDGVCFVVDDDGKALFHSHLKH